MNFTRFPSNLAIFGMTATAGQCGYSQVLNLGGNASWEAFVYAPNARITLNGGGNSGFMAGAVVDLRLEALFSRVSVDYWRAMAI